MCLQSTVHPFLLIFQVFTQNLSALLTFNSYSSKPSYISLSFLFFYHHNQEMCCKLSTCVDLTPPCFKLLSFPRATRGGGLAAIYRDHFPFSVKTTFPFTHSSFELVEPTLIAPQHIHFSRLFRPPPSKRNKLSDSLFLSEFPDFLEYCNPLRGKRIILGDFNVHFDTTSKHLTSKMLEIVTTFDIVEGVKVPPHRCGHIIELMLYRANEQLISSCSVGHTTVSSDHLSMLCHLEVARPQRQAVFREVWNIKGINRYDFRKDVAAIVDTQPELTALQLNEELRSLLDKHAPAGRRKVPSGLPF